MKILNWPVCGTRISANADRCPECGFQIKNYIENKNVKPANNTRKLRIFILFLSLTAIVILAVVYAAVRKEHTSSLQSKNALPDAQAAAGVYSGDDHEILAICDNGLAYYYCSAPEFTELECPWSFDNNHINIELSKLHCVISADTENNDFTELIFKSDSINWNTEVFSRIDLDPYDYITRKPESNDPAVSINSDGTMAFAIRGIHFIIPKQYRDPADEFDSMDNAFAFVDNDAQTDYSSSLLFYTEKNSYSEAELDSHIDQMLNDFSARFIKKTVITNLRRTRVAEQDAYTADLEGTLNSGFTGLSGYRIDGKIAYVPDESEGCALYILMFQSSNRNTDSSAVYDNILNSAEISD